MREAAARWGLWDRHLWVAAALAFGLRVAMLGVGSPNSCTRDECSYRQLARGILAGDGLQAHDGWLWAPGWPYVMAAVGALTGHIWLTRVLQILLGTLLVVLVYRLGRRLAEGDAGVRLARASAWILALHPTQAYFSASLWSETTYSVLLTGAVLAVLWAREGPENRGFIPGILMGLAVLFRGVATYVVPLVAVAALWPLVHESWHEALRRRGLHAATVVVGALIVVAPYTGWATRTHGGFLVSDATLGQMMYLGNNDFAPVSFDYGSGYTVNRARDAVFATGRPHCDQELPPAQWNACEVERGRRWIAAHPVEFAARVPLRVAQLLDPHTFLTRHLRWGHPWRLPWLLEELAVLWVVLTSLAVTLGGTLGAAGRARGPYGFLSLAILAYHLAAIAGLAGLSRYRVPLEPLWIPYLAMVFTQPAAVREGLRGWRLAALAVALPVLVWLIAWFLPTGWPGWW